MRYTILFIFLCFILTTKAFAMSSNEYVSALENRLFGATYESQPIDKRIDRIESQIYDNVYSGTPEERLSKIDKIYPKSDFEITSRSPQNYNNDYFGEEYSQEEIQPAEYNNYPIVSKIEQTIYNKDYSGEDIYKRLSRLEKELYGQEKSNLTLQERVENLKSVLPKKERHPIASSGDFSFKGFDFGKSSGGYYDTSSILGELERATFKKTFKDENTDSRLSRLENFYFGQSSSGQNEDERTTRLASIILSDKNSPMPSVKTAQWAEILMNLLIIGLGFLL